MASYVVSIARKGKALEHILVPNRLAALRVCRVASVMGDRVWAKPDCEKITLPEVGPLPIGDSLSHRDFTRRVA